MVSPTREARETPPTGNEQPDSRGLQRPTTEDAQLPSKGCSERQSQHWEDRGLTISRSGFRGFLPYSLYISSFQRFTKISRNKSEKKGKTSFLEFGPLVCQLLGAQGQRAGRAGRAECGCALGARPPVLCGAHMHTPAVTARGRPPPDQPGHR